MGFGDLIGGAVERYGQRSWEETTRQRRLEDIGLQANFDALLGHLTKNYDTMTPEEIEATANKMETLYPGTKKGTLGPLIGGVRAIGSIIPPRPMSQEALPNTPPSQVAVTPSQEPAVGGIAAPASIQMTQMPQPGAIGTPSIYAPQPGYTVRSPSQTPGMVKSQRLSEQQRLEREMKRREIQASSLPERYKQMAEANTYGLNVVPYESTVMRTEAQERIAAAKEDDIKNVAFHVERGGQQYPVYMSALGPMWDDPVTGIRRPFTAAPGDRRLERPVPYGFQTGKSDVFAVTRDPREPPSATGLNIGVKPPNPAVAASRDFRDEMALRKDFENHPITKQADETARQVKLAEGALAQGSTNFVAIDQALINVFNKMIDPTSVVREGEYARTIENTPLLNRIKGKVAAVQSGGAGLTNEERKALLAVSKRFAADSQAAFGARANEFRRIATENKMNPSNVVVTREGSGGNQAGGGRRQQFSKSTGKYRHMLPGDTTWRLGPLPKQ